MVLKFDKYGIIISDLDSDISIPKYVPPKFEPFKLKEQSYFNLEPIKPLTINLPTINIEPIDVFNKRKRDEDRSRMLVFEQADVFTRLKDAERDYEMALISSAQAALHPPRRASREREKVEELTKKYTSLSEEWNILNYKR